MFAIDAAAGADVVAHLFQPRELIWLKDDSCRAFFFEPLRETLFHMFFEWFEWCRWFDRGANERNEVSEAAGRRIADRGIRIADFGVGIPKCRYGLRAELRL